MAKPQTFREFVTDRFGSWPGPGDAPPWGYSTWDVPLTEALADWLDQRDEKKKLN